MVVTYEAMNMLFQAIVAFATIATAIIVLIVLFTNKKEVTAQSFAEDFDGGYFFV